MEFQQFFQNIRENWKLKKFFLLFYHVFLGCYSQNLNKKIVYVPKN